MPLFLFTRRWVKLLVFALLVAALCIRLGFWQISRLHDKRAYNAAILAGMAAEPAPLEKALAGSSDPQVLAYARVSATGSFDTDHEVILYGRSLSNDQPGNHVLTPLVMDDGTAILVDRGWVPLSLDSPPVAGAEPAADRLVVVGILYRAEAAGPPSSEPVTDLTQVDISRIGGALPYQLAPVYLKLQSQTPPQEGDLPRPEPPGSLDEGPHLNYAIQWFTFATIALLGYIVLVVREARRLRTDGEQPNGPSTQGPPAVS